MEAKGDHPPGVGTIVSKPVTLDALAGPSEQSREGPRPSPLNPVVIAPGW